MNEMYQIEQLTKNYVHTAHGNQNNQSTGETSILIKYFHGLTPRSWLIEVIFMEDTASRKAVQK